MHRRARRSAQLLGRWTTIAAAAGDPRQPHLHRRLLLRVGSSRRIPQLFRHPKAMEDRIRYFFRMPQFPLLLDTGTELISLSSADECEIRLPALALTGEPRPVIDARAEGFAFYPDLDTITPLTLKKDWTKAELVALYDARKRSGAPAYTRSLPNRKLSAVVSDIISLVAADRAATGPRRQ